MDLERPPIREPTAKREIASKTSVQFLPDGYGWGCVVLLMSVIVLILLFFAFIAGISIGVGLQD